jgi:hypothetical protein
MTTQGFNLDQFRAKFSGGARSYLFYFRPMFPAAFGITTEDAQYLVKTTSLPESTLTPITVPWQGYDFKMAGRHEYADLTVTFNVDINSRIRLAYERWSHFIHDPETNIYEMPDNYMQDQILYLLDYNGDPMLTYKLFGAWPTSIGAVTLDYSAIDVAQFDVTFSYQRHMSYEGKAQ